MCVIYNFRFSYLLLSSWPVFIVSPGVLSFSKWKEYQKRVERGAAVSLLFCCLLWAWSCFLNELLNVNIHVERLKNFQVTHGKCWFSEIISMSVCRLIIWMYITDFCEASVYLRVTQDCYIIHLIVAWLKGFKRSTTA